MLSGLRSGLGRGVVSCSSRHKQPGRGPSRTELASGSPLTLGARAHPGRPGLRLCRQPASTALMWGDDALGTSCVFVTLGSAAEMGRGPLLLAALSFISRTSGQDPGPVQGHRLLQTSVPRPVGTSSGGGVRGKRRPWGRRNPPPPPRPLPRAVCRGPSACREPVPSTHAEVRPHSLKES